jgi:endonuclease/exonuclease/phosphatase (EEP) superfamily protein YafD
MYRLPEAGSRRISGQPRRDRWRALAARTLAAVPLGLTLMPLSRTGKGWVRIWDFPRVQIAGLGLIAQAAMLRWGTTRPADRALTAALAASLLYQLGKMAPYTPLYPPEVPAASNTPADVCVRLFMANVLQENRRFDLLQRRMEEAAPDVICLLEVDAWWAGRMEPLRKEYKWVSEHPLDNHYGMLLYSRLPITACDVRFLVSPDVPSMRAIIQLRSGDEVVLYAVHPPPPLPNSPSYGRDAELVLTGREIQGHGRPTIVIGDLNDVAWSYTTKLFQRVGRMLDPRVGRGMFSTFHAEHRFARYPLDHVFHTRDFSLRELRRLGYTGSDHFPIVVELAFTPSRTHEVPRAPTAADLANAEEMVEDAREARPYVDANGEGRVASAPS